MHPCRVHITVSASLANASYIPPTCTYSKKMNLPTASGAACRWKLARRCTTSVKKALSRKHLHQLKYREPGGYRRADSAGGMAPCWQTIALVPKGGSDSCRCRLHPLKERLRGYNQSAMLATRSGGKHFNVPVLSGCVGAQDSSFQPLKPAKKRMDRFGNVNEVFALRRALTYSG
jgi:hypothetical protein